MMLSLDLNARKNEGHAARNVAMLAGHLDIAAQLLTRDIDNYLGAAHIWQQMRATLSRYSRSRTSMSQPSARGIVPLVSGI